MLSNESNLQCIFGQGSSRLFFVDVPILHKVVKFHARLNWLWGMNFQESENLPKAI